MNSKDMLTLLQKVGVAAMMNDPPMVVENLKDVLMSIDVSNIRSFLDKPEAQNVNCMAALRGLEELSARYFRDQTRFKSLSAEVVQIFHALPRKRALPKASKSVAIGQPSMAVPAVGRPSVVNGLTTTPPLAPSERATVSATENAATIIPIADKSYTDQLRATQHSFHPPLPSPFRPLDANVSKEPHILDEDIGPMPLVDAIEDVLPRDEQLPIEFTEMQLYEQQLLAESLLPPREIVEDGNFGENEHPVVEGEAALVEPVTVDERPQAEPVPTPLVVPNPPSSPRPPRQPRRRRADNDPNYRQPRLPTLAQIQASVVGSIHQELAMRQASQQAPSQEPVIDAVTSAANIDVAGANDVRANVGTAEMQPPIIRISLADEVSVDMLQPSHEMLPPPPIYDIPIVEPADQQLPASLLPASPAPTSMRQSHIAPMFTSTPARRTRALMAQELFAEQSPPPLAIPSALSPLPPVPPVPVVLSPQPPVPAALVPLSPEPVPVARRLMLENAIDNVRQCSVLLPIDIALVVPKSAPQLMFGTAQPCDSGQKWQRSSAKQVCLALRSAEVPLRAASLLRRSARLSRRQSSPVNSEGTTDELDVSARQAFHTICNMHNKRLLRMHTNGVNNTFDSVSLD